MQPKLEVTETRDTPYIIFDPENDQFEISGNCLPEDSTKFFEPIFDWIEKYIHDPLKDTILVCKLEYFNSSSAKMFYQVFIELENLKDTGNEIKIIWQYEAGDKLIEEKGLEYQSILEIPFELQEIK